ncbi:MAG: ABC transporter substrate-binding protein, partial [Anaerolineales bacterium]
TLKGWMTVSLIAAATLALGGCAGIGGKKVYHVGILSGLDWFAPAADGFKSKMTELGYVEGDNIVYDLQSTTVDLKAYQTVLQKFVQDKVDLIFVFPTEAALEAKAATQGTNIPVVFDLAAIDIEGQNLIDSVSHPGGNITGVRFPGADISSKRLEILLECAPEVKRIFVPYLKDYPTVPSQLTAIEQRASALGVTLIEYATTSPQDLQAEMDRRAGLSDIGLDAIMLIAEPLSITPDFVAVLGKFAYERKLPMGGAPTSAGDYTTFFGLIPDALETGRLAAVLADKILRGTSAGTIPVVSPEGYLSFYLPAAQAMGVTIPQGLLAQANEVVR